ncbi:MAG: ATPase, T2SS/T4P/T4SS family [Candidatus Omnitrophota bacterium]
MPNRQKFISGFLIAKGIVNFKQLQQAKLTQNRTQERIEIILKNVSDIFNENLSELIIEELGLSFVDASIFSQGMELLETVNSFLANRFRIFPLELENDILTLGFDNPLNFLCLEFFSDIVGFNVQGELISKEQMDALLLKHYPVEKEKIAQVDNNQDSEDIRPEDEAPIIQLVTMLISDAYQKRASDIHIEPMYDKIRIRYRVDGLLSEVQSPEKRLQAALTSRVKLMAGMNIAEKRLPQDGRIRTVVNNREFDLRVSTLPGHYGESVVLRILDRRIINIEGVGFSASQLEAFRKITTLPNGIILVTGPTGSGKSTTLYAVLNSMDRSRKKILTVEDPVEYQINGINQVQVKAKIGLSFARVLRSMLRQAPDVIMVGEIRDLETARISVQSALTGHLIFSTLHTNDAPSAITRLVDMGIQAYLTAATVQAVLAQRLVRLLCPECKQEYKPPKDEVKILELNAAADKYRLYQAKGCSHCSFTGYKGRTGIFELLILDEQIRQLAHEHVPSTVIRELARKKGMITLKEHAIEKVLGGLTTFQEVVRVTQSDID